MMAVSLVQTAEKEIFRDIKRYLDVIASTTEHKGVLETEQICAALKCKLLTWKPRAIVKKKTAKPLQTKEKS